MTTITLRPLTEQEVVDYVAATLSRPNDYVHSLAIVCLEKTNGCVKRLSMGDVSGANIVIRAGILFT